MYICPLGSINNKGEFRTYEKRLRLWGFVKSGIMESGWINLPNLGL